MEQMHVKLYMKAESIGKYHQLPENASPTTIKRSKGVASVHFSSVLWSQKRWRRDVHVLLPLATDWLLFYLILFYFDLLQALRQTLNIWRCYRTIIFFFSWVISLNYKQVSLPTCSTFVCCIYEAFRMPSPLVKRYETIPRQLSLNNPFLVLQYVSRWRKLFSANVAFQVFS